MNNKLKQYLLQLPPVWLCGFEIDDDLFPFIKIHKGRIVHLHEYKIKSNIIWFPEEKDSLYIWAETDKKRVQYSFEPICQGGVPLYIINNETPLHIIDYRQHGEIFNKT